MRENAIEKRLRESIERHDGISLKFVSPGNRGVPDRLVLLHGGRHIFVELKKPGEKPKPLQQWRHEQFRKLGHDVRVIDSLAGVDDFIREVLPK